MIYCPYTNSDIAETDSNREHILPLSLGGINGFEIPVSIEFNSNAGSKIDGALANDFLVKNRRNEFDIRGHSRKKPVVEYKKARCVETNKPLHVTIDKPKGMKIWSHRDQAILTGSRKIEFSFNMDVDIGLMFVAKTALSAGYFAYGDLFRGSVKHSDFRTIMSFRPNEVDQETCDVEARVDSWQNETDDEKLKILRMVCEAVKPSSIVGLLPGDGSFSVFVGVLGQYIGMINVPAETASFPNEGAYELGHVICPQNGNLVRVSFKRVLEKLCE